MPEPQCDAVGVAKCGRGVEPLSDAVMRPTEKAKRPTARTMRTAATRRVPAQLWVRGAETAIDDMDCLLLSAARGSPDRLELSGSTIGDPAPVHIRNPA